MIDYWSMDQEKRIIPSIRSRKDVRNIFKMHSVCSKKIEQIIINDSTNIPPRDSGSKVKIGMDSQCYFGKIIEFPIFPGSITRNSSLDLVNFKERNDKRKIYDAMATASILHNSSGIHWRHLFIFMTVYKVWTQAKTRWFLQMHSSTSCLTPRVKYSCLKMLRSWSINMSLIQNSREDICWALKASPDTLWMEIMMRYSMIQLMKKQWITR